MKFVAEVPDAGETEPAVRLPLSGQVTARTGATKAPRDIANEIASAMAPRKLARVLDRGVSDKNDDKMKGTPMDAPTMAPQAAHGPWERCRLAPVLW